MANDKKDTATTPSDNLVIVDTNSLAATIATAVAQAMAAAQAGNADSMAAIGKAVADGIAANTRRKITFGEYEAMGPRNVYHPKSKAETPQLKRNVWQNDSMLQHSTLFDREVVLFNRITHSGRYCDRKVEVICTEDDIYIRYNNKTADQRFELKNHFRSMEELLTIIVTEQEREDKETKELEDERLADRRKREEAKERFAFSGKATREARERAEG